MRDAAKQPDDATLWQRVVLSALLCNKFPQAELAHSMAIDCGNFDNIVDGHCFRDFTLYWIRHGKFDRAQKALTRAQTAHNDLMAGLDMVEARLLLTRGAVRTAFERFVQLASSLNNPQWRYNMLLPWLWAACWLGETTTVAILYKHIQTECPPGAKNRSAEARLVMALPAWALRHYLEGYRHVRRCLRA